MVVLKANAVVPVALGETFRMNDAGVLARVQYHVFARAASSSSLVTAGKRLFSTLEFDETAPSAIVGFDAVVPELAFIDEAGCSL